MRPLVIGAQAPTVHLTSQTRILAAAIAIVFMVLILELIRRNRLQERYSVVWFIAGLGMLAGAIFPGLLGTVAGAMGVRDPTWPSFRSSFCSCSAWPSTSA